HYQSANQLRSKLTQSELDMLGALEPVVRARPDFAEAARRMSELARAQPRALDLQVYAARTAYRAARFQESLTFADAGIALDTSSGAAHHARARVLLYMDRVAEAEAAYKKCFAVSPRASSCFDGLNEIEASDGRCKEAEELSREMIAIAPGEA